MGESVELPPPAEPPRRRPRWRRRLLLLLLLLAGIVLWWGSRPVVPTSPVRLGRGPDGKLLPVDGSLGSGGRLELHAGGIQANNSFVTTSSTSHPAHARFACRRMAIFNESDHLLMQRVGADLLQHLSALKGFEQIEYYPLGQTPEEGTLIPDVTVTLVPKRIETSGLPTARRLHAEILMLAGSSLMRHASHYFDGLGPPIVQFTITSTLEHESTSPGIGTPSARFKLAAEDIAQQLSKGLTDKLNEFFETDGALQEMPEALYPSYTEAPEFPLPPGESLEKIASYHGLMRSNESLWKWSTRRDLAGLLTDLESRWQESGWKTTTLQTAPDSLPHLRMKRGGTEVVKVYPQPKEQAELTIQGAEEAATTDGPSTLVLHYVCRMSRQQVSDVVGGLLDSGQRAESLLPFESLVRKEERQRLLQELEASRTSSPDAWLMIAKWHQAAGRDEPARLAVQRAQLLSRTLADPGNKQKQLDELAKKLELPLSRDMVPTPDLLESLGFVNVVAAENLDRELALEEKALFYAGSDDKTVIMAVHLVKQSSGSQQQYEMVHVTCWNGSRAWGRGGLSTSTDLQDVGRVAFRAEPIGSEDRFLLRTKLEAK